MSIYGAGSEMREDGILLNNSGGYGIYYAVLLHNRYCWYKCCPFDWINRQWRKEESTKNRSNLTFWDGA